MADVKSGCCEQAQLEVGARGLARKIFREFDVEVALSLRCADGAITATAGQSQQLLGDLQYHRRIWEEAFTQLVNSATEHLLGRASRVVPNHHNTEEPLCDFWRRHWQDAREHPARFANFFGQACRSHSTLGYILCAFIYELRHLPGPVREPVPPGRVPPEAGPPGAAPDWEEEMARRALEAVDSVGGSSQGRVQKREYHVFCARQLSQVDSRTVGKFHGISPATVRSDVHRFRERLMDYIRRHDEELWAYLERLPKPRESERTQTDP